MGNAFSRITVIGLLCCDQLFALKMVNIPLYAETEESRDLGVHENTNKTIDADIDSITVEQLKQMVKEKLDLQGESMTWKFHEVARVERRNWRKLLTGEGLLKETQLGWALEQGIARDYAVFVTEIV